MTRTRALSIRKLALAATLGTVGVAGLVGLSIRADAAATPANSSVHAVNVSDQSFGVAWFSKAAATGSTLTYGLTCATATTAVKEVAGSNGLAHLATTAGGLQPNTTYYFKLVVGGVTDTNGGACYTAKTFAAQALPPVPTTVYGLAKTATCSGAAKGALVQVSTSASTKLAAIADSNGHWALPFGELTDGTGGYINPGAGSSLAVKVATDATHSLDTAVTFNGTSRIVGPATACA